MSGVQDAGGRPIEIEEFTNRWFIHRVSAIVTPMMARMGISPNQVSVAGLGVGLLASVFYAQWGDALMVLGGFLAMVGWHILDGVDGRLARMTGQASDFGKFIDGVCDYLTFIVLYITLMVVADQPAWISVPLGLLASASHIRQAFHYEREREAYMHLAYGRPMTNDKPAQRLKPGIARFFFGWLYDIYTANQVRSAQTMFSPGLVRLCASDDGRDFYKRQIAGSVRLFGLLSANIRTLSLALSCLIAGPLFFFVFELVVLNVLLAFLGHRHRKLITQTLKIWTAKGAA